MEALMQAIESKFEASADLAGAVNGLLFERAPGRQATPYVLLQVEEAKRKCLFDATGIEDVNIRFVIVSDRPRREQTMDIYDKLTSAFDRVDLTIQGHTHIVMLRNGSRLSRKNKAWRFEVDYLVKYV